MPSLKGLLKNATVRFVLIGTFIYLGLYFLYELYIDPHTVLDEWIIESLVRLTEGMLHLFGFETTVYPEQEFLHRVGIAGFQGVFIGEPCNGFALFILFLAFIVAFPGPVKHKLWFIPAGIIAIHLINALRVTALVLIMRKYPDWLSFNHDYTFTIVVYSFVFFLWWIWINKLSPLKKKKDTPS